MILIWNKNTDDNTFFEIDAPKLSENDNLDLYGEITEREIRD